MRRLRAFVMLIAAVIVPAAVPALAQPVTSPGPDKVSIAIYRNPGRSVDNPIDPEWLEGFALVTEQRTVTIPQGRAVIRFEGVAGGILPESAIVTGLPEGVREKNLDADLLSPRSIYARSLGRPVTLRRTDKHGKVSEERVVIRSGPDGAAILQTKDGFEAARCEGQDSLVYSSVPEGLSAKPTLSVETEAARGGQVTLTLSYLAWGFDWQANYVATMRPDGHSADLFAWVTLANGDVTSFVDADTMAIAGRLNREDRADEYDDADEPEQELSFECFVLPVVAAPAPPPPPMAGFTGGDAINDLPQVESESAEIVVTASRIVRQEELGDLKLYRVPDRTTVAAKSQKQVAMLDKAAVPVEVVYRARVSDDYVDDVKLTLRAQNRKDKGLGVPLPAGQVAVFEPHGDRALLIGETWITDKSVNEEVEFALDEATQVTAEMDEVDGRGNWEDHELTVTNANPWPIRFEAEVDTGDMYRRIRTSARLGRRNGHDVWSVTVPANGSAKFRIRLKDVEEKDD